VLGARLLAPRDDPLGPSEVEDHVPAVEALHLAGQEVPDAVAVLAPDDLALGLLHLLVDDLLRRLGRDPGEGSRCLLLHRLEDHAELYVLADLLGVLERDLRDRVH
jgi:hypothetical protein